MSTDIKQKKFSPHRLNLEGVRFGHVVAKEYLGNSRWVCICDCGNSVIGTVARLKDGRRRSCGKCSFRYVNHGTHKGYKIRLWQIWDDMKTRCNNPNSHNYKHYGGRGIKICSEWLNFSAFREWSLSHGYADNLTIDRIDNEKGYSPDNCRWVTFKEQANNKRTNHFITYNGETKTIGQWSEATGLTWACIKRRIDAGWNIEKALNTPSKGKPRKAV